MSEEKQEQETTNNFTVVTDEAEGAKAPETQDAKAAPNEPEPEPEPEPKSDEKKAEGDDKDDGKESGQDEADSSSDRKRLTRRAEKRIGRLTKRAKTAESRAEKAERENAELRKQIADQKAESTKPKPEDFDDHDDYLKARDKWKADSEPEDDKKEKPLSSEEQDFIDARDLVLEAAEELGHKDWEKAIRNENLRMTQPMIIAMAETDIPGEIAYYLGKNPDEAAKIAEMKPFRQASEIGKLEAKLAADAEASEKAPEPEPEPKPSKKQSAAPAPIEPVKGKDASEKKPEDMSFKEFEAKRNEEERNRSSHW